MTVVWSCGGGTQSAAIAALIVSGQLEKPDMAVIVDTEREKSKTWAYASGVMIPALRAIGVELMVVPKSRYATVDLYSGNGDLLLPVFGWQTDEQTGDRTLGKLPGFCSNEWKARVVQRWMRDQGIDRATMWIGFSLDEKDRVRHGPPAWIVKRFPLIERRMRRGDCVSVVEGLGWPPPPRSACWMCPNMTNREWRELREESPQDFAKAVSLDAAIRERDPDVFLHSSGAPLKDADLGAPDNQMVLGCDSGNCFV